MRSTSGQHFLALDHIRAIAAFLVFSWHFLHSGRGFPVPLDAAPSIFPLSIINQGHTGVALFMTLSGYLFAKLLEGRQIRYGAFLWNRAVRLLPLLLLVVIRSGLKAQDPKAFALEMLTGVVMPVLPNGGWSITAEFHFYLVLPLLLALGRRAPSLPLLVIAFALVLRTGLYAWRGEIESLAYWTIIGRIDQFVLGMVAYSFRHHMAGKHGRAFVVFLAFAVYYAWFDRIGGFAKNSASPLCITIGTIEGLAYGALIAWYDQSFAPKASGFSAFFGKIGEYSYSIYLLHFFFTLQMTRFITAKIMDISNFYVGTAWSVVGFLLMVPIAWASYTFIEKPFLRFRKPYIITETKG